MGMATPAWAADGTWVGQLPRQTIVVADHALESAPVELPASMADAVIERVRWTFRLDAPALTLKTWLCHGQFCLPLARNRGETQRFADRSASLPFRLRFQWQPGEQSDGRRVIFGGQLIVDYRH
ncbi:hypothetical protein BTW07_14885 [Salinicola socius]|uniref:Flagellar FlhE n=2 Tax=Salinicola socius TaxID=404433 RepID=A0A1Q8SPL9_9GAMM|nr:hypothetical protein BTW07_14885 [Salinicola socius]